MLKRITAIGLVCIGLMSCLDAFGGLAKRKSNPQDLVPLKLTELQVPKQLLVTEQLPVAIRQQARRFTKQALANMQDYKEGRQQIIPLGIEIPRELGQQLSEEKRMPSFEDLEAGGGDKWFKVKSFLQEHSGSIKLAPALFLMNLPGATADRLSIHAKTDPIDWAIVAFIAIEVVELDLIKETLKAMIIGSNQSEQEQARLLKYAYRLGAICISSGLVAGAAVGAALGAVGANSSHEMMEMIEAIIRFPIVLSLSWCASEFLGRAVYGPSDQTLVDIRRLNAVGAPGLLFHPAEISYFLAFLFTAESEEWKETFFSTILGLALGGAIHYGITHLSAPAMKHVGTISALTIQLALLIYFGFAASHDWEEGEVGGEAGAKAFDATLATSTILTFGGKFAYESYKHRRRRQQQALQPAAAENIAL